MAVTRIQISIEWFRLYIFTMKKLLLFVFCLISVGTYAQTQITTAAQFQNIKNNLGGDYILMNDIDLSSIYFTPIGSGYNSYFTGTFDGNGHTITISDVNASSSNRGVFGQVGTGGTVKNLVVKGTIQNDLDEVSYVGGIAGKNYGTITNCCSFVNINVSGYDYNSPKSVEAGGIAGYNYGTITYCFATSTEIMGPKNNSGTGGIVGLNDNNATIQNCVFVGNISDGWDTKSKYYGLICGNKYNTYNNVTNNYYLSGGNYTGLGGMTATPDEGHCTALSQLDIRALARTGGVYASTTNDVFKNAILTFPFTIDFQESDGIAVFNSIKGEPANVTLRRSATKDKKCTICLPFDVPQDQLASLGSFYVFSGLKSGTTDVVQMTEVTSGGLKANTAYVFEPKSGYAVGPHYAGIEFKNVTIANTLTPVTGTGTFRFIGTYEAKTWEAGDPDLGKVYGFAIAGYEGSGFTAGQFVMLGAGASAVPFRAYLKYVPETSSAPHRAPFTLPDVLKIEWISSNNTTNISTVNHLTKENDWFTLEGRKLNGSPTKKGIYVNNGKKVLVK